MRTYHANPVREYSFALCFVVLSLFALPTQAAYYTLVYGDAARTSSATQELNGQTFSGDVYFRLDSDDEANITDITFYIDDEYAKYEPNPPYDLAGGQASGNANPYDTTTLADGTHELKAVIDLVAGDTFEIEKTFVVNNSGTNNNAPVLNTVGNQTVTAGTAQDITLSASDADGDSLTYSLDSGPSFVSVSGNTLTIDDNSSAGTYSVTVSVDDGTDTDSETFTLTVNSSGTGGSCSTSLTQEAESGGLSGVFDTGSDGGVTYVYTPADQTSTTDELGDNYAEYCFDITQAGTYQIHGTARALSGSYNSFNVTVDGSSTYYSWAFTANNSFVTEAISGGNGSGAVEEFALSAGQHIVRFYMREDGAQLDKVSLVLQGSGSNSAPVLNTIGNQTATAGTLQNITLSASDADSGDTLTFSLGGGAPSFVTLTNNNNGTATLNISSASAAGDHSITVTVTDGTDTDSETFILSVSSTGGSGNVADIILDNDNTNNDANTEGSVSSTGSWPTSTSNTPFTENNYAYSIPSSSNATFTFTPNVQTAGQYKVHAWWTQHSNRSESVVFTITDQNGSTPITKSQRINGGVWIQLGETFTFAAGTSGSITITASPDSGHSYTADGIWLEYVGETDENNHGNETPIEECDVLQFTR